MKVKVLAEDALIRLDGIGVGCVFYIRLKVLMDAIVVNV